MELIEFYKFSNEEVTFIGNLNYYESVQYEIKDLNEDREYSTLQIEFRKKVQVTSKELVNVYYNDLIIKELVDNLTNKDMLFVTTPKGLFLIENKSDLSNVISSTITLNCVGFEAILDSKNSSTKDNISNSGVVRLTNGFNGDVNRIINDALLNKDNYPTTGVSLFRENINNDYSNLFGNVIFRNKDFKIDRSYRLATLYEIFFDYKDRVVLSFEFNKATNKVDIIIRDKTIDNLFFTYNDFVTEKGANDIDSITVNQEVTKLKNSAFVLGAGEMQERNSVFLGSDDYSLQNQELIVDARNLSREDTEESEKILEDILENRELIANKLIENMEALIVELDNVFLKYNDDLENTFGPLDCGVQFPEGAESNLCAFVDIDYGIVIKQQIENLKKNERYIKSFKDSYKEKIDDFKDENLQGFVFQDFNLRLDNFFEELEKEVESFISRNATESVPYTLSIQETLERWRDGFWGDTLGQLPVLSQKMTDDAFEILEKFRNTNSEIYQEVRGENNKNITLLEEFQKEYNKSAELYTNELIEEGRSKIPKLQKEYILEFLNRVFPVNLGDSVEIQAQVTPDSIIIFESKVLSYLFTSENSNGEYFESLDLNVGEFKTTNTIKVETTKNNVNNVITR